MVANRIDHDGTFYPFGLHNRVQFLVDWHAESGLNSHDLQLSPVQLFHFSDKTLGHFAGTSEDRAPLFAIVEEAGFALTGDHVSGQSIVGNADHPSVHRVEDFAKRQGGKRNLPAINHSDREVAVRALRKGLCQQSLVRLAVNSMDIDDHYVGAPALVEPSDILL